MRGDFRRVGFFGLGKSNLSLMSLLPSDTEVALRSDAQFDRKKLSAAFKLCRIYEGEHSCDNISEELLILSPSVRRDRPDILSASERGTLITSDHELFFEAAAAPVLGVTGSDGKSTTATMANLILSCDHSSSLVGNIGEPMAEALLNKKSEIFVAELSSFMLNFKAPHTRRSVITNITPNHLNWHKDLREYINSKLSLIKASDEAVLSADGEAEDEFLSLNSVFAVCSVHDSYRELRSKYRAEHFLTLQDGFILLDGERLISTDRITAGSSCNIKNFMSAIALTYGYWNKDALEKVAQSFHGLSHRCQKVFERNDICYIDSSIDTTPARTKSTLVSLNKGVTLLLGGRGKGLDYKALLPEIRLYAEKVIAFGEDRELIASALSEFDVLQCAKLSDAVSEAKRVTKEGGTVLLSPAATSYDEFENFEDRGRKYKEIITKLYK